MRIAVAVTIYGLLLLLALAVDGRVAGFVRGSGWEDWIEADHGLRGFLKLPGDYRMLIAAALAALCLHRLRWRAAGLVAGATLASLLTGVIKWAVGRHRPYTWLHDQSEALRTFEFVPFRGGIEGLLGARNLSFPSGHAAMAFALATALTMLWPRGRWLWYTAAGACAWERVWENAHYLSEVIAGSGLGVAVVWLLAAVWRRVDPVWETLMSGETLRTSPATGASATRRPVAVDVSEGNGMHPFLSLVIPAYNEQEVIPELLARVEQALTQIQKPYEVVIVDDGSTDQTPRLLAEAMTSRPWLRIVRMERNAGQSAAFEAGFAAARGEIIATIDADLQNDPEEIPRLLPLLDEKGVDMITGWRKDRQDTPFRRWQSRQANRIRNWISRETVNDSASSLKLYRAHAVKGLKLFNGAHRFFPTLVKMRGYTCFETPVRHSQRFAGTAKYGFRNRALRALVDLLAVRWMKERALRYEATEIRKEVAGGQ